MSTDLIPLSVEHEGAMWPLWRRPESAVPLAKDLDVAAWLGYETPRNIRKLITRYRDELGEVSLHRGAKPSSVGGRPEEGSLLAEAQALFLAAKSETPKATQVLKAMIAVFLRARDMLAKPPPAPALDEEAVRAMVRREVAELERAAAARHSQLGDGLRRAFTGQGTQLQVLADQIDGRADEVLGALAEANEMSEARAHDLLDRLGRLPDAELVVQLLRESEARTAAGAPRAITAQELLALLGQALTQVAGDARGAGPTAAAPARPAWPPSSGRVTTRGAAAILGIEPNTLLKRIHRGEQALMDCAVNRRPWVFDVARLLAYQAARRGGIR